MIKVLDYEILINKNQKICLLVYILTFLFNHLKLFLNNFILLSIYKNFIFTQHMNLLRSNLHIFAYFFIF